MFAKYAARLKKASKFIPQIEALDNVSTHEFHFWPNMKKKFFWKIITGNKKWVNSDNPKYWKSWLDSGQPTKSTAKMQKISYHFIFDGM